MYKTVVGALAGLAATVPMTIFLKRAKKELPLLQKYPLPPRQITMAVADSARLKHKLPWPARTVLTYAAHYGYGAAMGTAYGAVEKKVPGNPLVKGVGFGLSVWAVSYLVGLPALGLLRPATKLPAARNALMIAAHVIWGATLAMETEALSKKKKSFRSRLRIIKR